MVVSSPTSGEANDPALKDDVKRLLTELNLPAGKLLSLAGKSAFQETAKPQKSSEQQKREKGSRKKRDPSKSKTESGKRRAKAENKTAKNGKDKTKRKEDTISSTLLLSDEEETGKSFADTSSTKMEMLMEDELWYEKLSGLGKISSKDSKRKLNEGIILQIRQKAQDKLENELRSYEQRVKSMERKDPDYAWMSKVIESGTLTDKIAAMALKISHSPVHNLTTMDNLLSMVQKKGRREAKIAMEALRDLYINNLLPNRHLIPFGDRPVKNPRVSSKHLVLWYFEEELKGKYLRFVEALQQWTADNLMHVKRAAITSVFTLLKEKPEQESFLLMILVNKLGDTDKKTASHVVHLLQQLVLSHPNMRQVITKEVEQFLFQQKIDSRGLYYGVIFLNQLVLQRNEDEELAKKLISIYIQLFKLLLSNDSKKDSKGKKDKRKSKNIPAIKETGSSVAKSRFLSALLTGVNRAFPYANSQGDELEEQINFLFEVVHSGTFSTSTQALMLLLHIIKPEDEMSGRFYRALYAKLLSPDLILSSKQTLFLNLLFRAMKADVEISRVRAFAKRLLQVACVSRAQFAAGALFLVSSVIQIKQELIPMFKVKGDEEEMKLYYAKHSLDVIREGADDQDDDDDESDDSSGDESDHIKKPKLNIIGTEPLDSSKDKMQQEQQKDTITPAVDPGTDSQDYDPMKRDPLHARAITAFAWEIEALSRHYHPSVRNFVEMMVKSKTCKIEYNGDPLRDFSNSAFLDKFVYRNPRKKDIENIKRSSKFGMEGRVGRQGSAATAQPVNSPSFLLKKPEQISSDQKFFYQFFHQKAKLDGRSLIDDMKLAKERAKKAKRRANDPFAEYESDEEEEAFAQKLAEKMLRDSGGGEIDVDPDFDFDYSSDESESAEEDSKAKASMLKKKNEDDMVFADDSDNDSFDGDLFESPEDAIEESGEDSESDSGNGKASPFADLDSFEAIMSEKDKTNPKQIEWENRTSTKRKKPVNRNNSKGRSKKRKGRR
mmetsp:Transcript_3118/g.3515  ORF Transcript_3118/g.3515 Transcript_3118/m.3515 type:complete len:1005 (+) Transcript_3118:54-3068(+)